MTERPSKQSPARLETAEFEPGLLDDLGPEDIARLERGEALPPRAPLPPVPAAGGAGTPAADVESIDLPVHAVAYEAPREPPGRTDHDTFEMQTVTVESAEDPQKAPTQRKLRGPVERDTIPAGARREPTLRGLHTGAPGADEAPPSAGPAPVVVPGPTSPPAVEPRLANEERPAARPTSTRAGRGWMVAGVVGAVIVVGAMVGSRGRPLARPASSAAVRSVEPSPPAVEPSPPPAVSAPALPRSASPAVPSVEPSAGREPTRPRPVNPTAPSSSGQAAPSAKAPVLPDPDRPFL